MTTREIIGLEDRCLLPTYAKLPIALVRGEGCNVWDADGRKYLDFYGGHCVTPLGHCPPSVVDAIKRQAESLLFYSNVVYNPVRAEAGRLLTSLCPPEIDHVFFCNSGTEANETALKLARKATGRSRVLAFKNGFHGRTLGALAATFAPKYREPYSDALGPVTFADLNDWPATEKLLSGGEFAAVIVEPIQSMAGMVAADAAFLRHTRELCREVGTMLIYDEVQTGVGRTGTFSISESLEVVPDLITMAKSLGSGIPVGAVLATKSVAQSVEVGDQGTTFGGGMIAMASVIATVETIVADRLMERAYRIYERMRDGLSGDVVSLRGRGCLIGIELDRPAKSVINRLRENGILVGGSNDPRVLRVMPPMNAPDDLIDHFLSSFRRAVAEHEWVASA